MMSKFNLRWPWEVKVAMDAASVAAANIDIAAPECTVPWGLQRKFIVVESMPVVAAAVCLLIFWGKWAWKRHHKRQRLWRHGHRVIGAFVLIMYLSVRE
jgi:hypothetical protein